ncbi:hypothetical protein SAY87_031270 [Trapa incisa]|uniref:AAA+ ATPase domain-containing protein n=1 Tax=Trapa incisa TaxID=236973 RepID=A0AAN7KUP9_9MYRT|nr:hypothetical protein SAY87_031270 [Trapa incisa]
MTRPVRSRILKDVNGDISDHLRNHIHLTNCIHLKNHMHKHSPILSDRSLMRDLIALQRSRSLRDPSASPPSWHSHSLVELLPRKGEKQGGNIIQEGRRSVGAERPRQGMRLSGNSPPFALLGSTRVAPREDEELASAVGEHREESLHDILSGKSDSIQKKIKQKGKQIRDPQYKNFPEQLNSTALDSDDVVSSNIRPKDRFLQSDKRAQETGSRNYGGGVNRGKRRRFRASRRPRPLVASRDVAGKSELSVASNSLGQGPASLPMEEEEVVEGEEEEEYREHNTVSKAPKSGCGLPWNWSRIHHRGKTFFDKAGRSLSCGLSERRRDGSDLPVASDSFEVSSKSEAEALPLLNGSQGSSEKLHDFSGELGIFSDHLLKHNMGSDVASEARSGSLLHPRNHRSRHQNLTQKYMPRSFRDLVGQNLVAQALSNAVVRRKIGLLYVFYGPHGTGKTSCARIFAKALNCQSSEDPKPCGYCNSCVAHNSGKSRHMKEVGPVSNFDFENIIELLDNMVISHISSHSQYRVFIFDDCDNLSSDCWAAISKVIDRAPRRVVIILVCSSLEVLPHIIISRCHKFFFPKLKDADIIYTLQRVSSKECLQVDKDALKLIASRSDGSLRDALMTLDQLSLLGQRISVLLVQELVGLISDEKLVDLLDLALSADTVNTVKNLRVIMEMGVEPLALMSQLATVITDILAGTYDFTKERNRRKFFRRLPLSKEEMERLRQALKTLSEAEKQLRMTNDKTTWLTAALLQLAPDQQYMMPTSADNSFNHSPLPANNMGVRESNGWAPEHVDNGRGWPLNNRVECIHPEGSSKIPGISSNRESRFDSRGNARVVRPHTGITSRTIDNIWLEVIDKVPIDSVKEFLFQEGRLISVSFGAAPTVQLLFSSHLTKTKAEKFREHILQAFETVLGSMVTIEIRCESKRDTRSGSSVPLPLPAPRDNISHVGRSEIVELEPSPRDPKGNGADKRVREEHSSSHMKVLSSYPERRKVGERSPIKSIVRGKVSLAHVIQEAGEGCSQRNSWSKRKAVSIAEKLEQENLRLEPKSRSLLSWNASQATRRKLSQLKIKARRPRSLLRLVSCGRCLSKSRR